MNEKQRIAVAIVIHQQKVLVGKRASNAKTAQGFHEVPGGKIEKGESASTAAIRECLEETGLHISIERQVNKSFTDEGCLEIIFFLGSLNSSVNPEPYIPFKWLTRAKLDLCTFPAANKDAVDWLRDFLLIN